MRYTASAAMEERTLRDVERWKDKIEIRLDNRQVFFLFFGSALVACLLFILGVVVGKRLESRGRAATPEIEDPLALLDRIAATPGTADEGITFPRALIQAPGKPGKEKGDGKARPAEAQKALALAPKPEPKAEPKAETKPEPKVEPKPEPAKAEPKPEPKAAVAAKPAAVPEAKSVAVAAAAPAVAAKPAPKTPAEAPAEKPSADKKGKFTLQLGSFQSREEADAFMAKFASESPFIVVSDIPEKGRWYRVRVGNYESSEEAVAAKAQFERAHRQIAYVAPR